MAQAGAALGLAGLRVSACPGTGAAAVPLETSRAFAAGARLVRHGAAFAEAASVAVDAAARPDHRFVHPYGDPAVVVGQGDAGAEIVADEPAVDTVVAAVGGGGLVAGTVLVIAGRAVVVEPEGCRCLHDALAAGKPANSPVGPWPSPPRVPPGSAGSPSRS
ncbi:pyridoxal-phosphate dependent enzyme [Streptomyces termitum]|uniref:Tryptophan synthase beta chain-like PALP domain-containing protein n=1 Tax=Streptomyces termitum TaxID=67368 RepID=A0A918WCW2_9ACTN|nr:pyridoxal-phosphate dependent enzyme [Streptomyces termitum]GHB08594.1 hypothetical protein GCM10010305_59490 [Streptomyces termitum]